MKYKKCAKCKEIKPLTGFYKDKTRKVGTRPYCKDCEDKRVKDWISKNKEKYSELQRNWKGKNKGRIAKIENRWKIKNKERWLELQRQAQVGYNKRYPEKIEAHRLLRKSVNNGEQVQLACQVCGNFLSEAHHYDYSKPLDVWWLCKKHHRLADKGELTLYV